MSKVFALLLLAGVATKGSVPKGTKDDERLKFHIVSARSSDESPSIQVTFPNGNQDDLVLEPFRVNANSAKICSYTGHLRNDPSSRVAVTGCMTTPGDQMEVTMISHSNINKMFLVDFDGNAEVIENPFEKQRSIVKELDSNNSTSQRESDAINSHTRKSIPRKMKATIKFGYEDGMKMALQREGTTFDEWIYNVVPHAQVHFQHPSLGTEIEFEVLEGSLYQEGATWYADGDANDAHKASINAINSGIKADSFSWWGNSGCSTVCEGVLGVAWRGTLCSSTGYNLNLNEKQSTYASSGFVLAHELGHNFGMFHDFHDVHGGENGPCNGKGIMSYGSFEYDEWSKCSRSDFEKTFHKKNWGTWCLDDISGLDGCLTNNAGYSCKVPFSYLGKEYYECTKDALLFYNRSVPWCYDVRGFGNWAYCSNCVQNNIIRDAQNDNKKCGGLNSSHRLFTFRGKRASEKNCKAKCAQNEDCVAFSGIWNQWCIGCDVELTTKHQDAIAFKKDEE